MRSGDSTAASSHTFLDAILQKSLVIFWLESQTEVINVDEKTYELCYNVISHQELLSVDMLMTSHYIRRSSFCLWPIPYVELTLGIDSWATQRSLCYVLCI